MLQVADPTGTYGFAYDNMGRLISTTTNYTFLPGPTFSNIYTYDPASNRTSLTAPDGSISTYGYDTLNRLNGLANSWAGSFGFSYDALSRRTQLTRPNGVTTNYSYDSLSHLLSVLHQAGVNTLDGASYTYDAAGNHKAKTNHLNGITSNYSYDALYELTQVTQGTSTTESYSYDPVGNRLSSSGVPTYSYNTSNELTSNSSGSYSYDANGNTLTDARGRSYTWDFENRLTQVVNPGVGTTTFRYDPFGRRIQKSGPLGTTNYLYDGNDLIEETDNSGTVLAKYTGENEIDEPLAEFRSGTASYYEQDGQGSISSLSNSGGALANTYTYDSFGKLINSTGSISNPFQYTAREFDSETQLYFNRARYRDPATGQWLSEDPIRFFGGHDFYSYVVNNPLRYRDPLGWQSQMPSCYPDCVHTQQEIDQMQREHEATMERIFPPTPPGPPSPPANPNADCQCKRTSGTSTTYRDLETLASLYHFTELLVEVPFGVGVGVSGVVGGAAICITTGAESFGAGCFAGAAVAGAGAFGGYYITKSALEELDEILARDQDCP